MGVRARTLRLFRDGGFCIAIWMPIGKRLGRRVAPTHRGADQSADRGVIFDW